MKKEMSKIRLKTKHMLENASRMFFFLFIVSVISGFMFAMSGSEQPLPEIMSFGIALISLLVTFGCDYLESKL